MLDLETHVLGSGTLLVLWSVLYQSVLEKEPRDFIIFYINAA